MSRPAAAARETPISGATHSTKQKPHGCRVLRFRPMITRRTLPALVGQRGRLRGETRGGAATGRCTPQPGCWRKRGRRHGSGEVTAAACSTMCACSQTRGAHALGEQLKHLLLGGVEGQVAHVERGRVEQLASLDPRRLRPVDSSTATPGHRGGRTRARCGTARPGPRKGCANPDAETQNTLNDKPPSLLHDGPPPTQAEGDGLGAAQRLLACHANVTASLVV